MLFIQYLQSDPQYYVAVILSVIISIVLHELAHGLAAIRQGDDTPIHAGHMTGNPLVHMGPASLATLFVVGLAWGRMPVDPSRFRGRYGDAIVAAAGPTTNLLLALLALTSLGLWDRYATSAPMSFAPAEEIRQTVGVETTPGIYAGVGLPSLGVEPTQVRNNARQFLFVFGIMNGVLFIFNLLPVPPLDGSAILANFHRGYATFIHERASPAFLLFLFVLVFGISSEIVRWVAQWGVQYTIWVTRL